MGPRPLLWIVFGLVVAAMAVAVAADLIGDALGRGDQVTVGFTVVAVGYGLWRLGRAIRCQVQASVRSNER